MKPVSVLHVEDCLEDHLIVKDFIERIRIDDYSIVHMDNFEDGVKAYLQGGFDVCLLDFHLGVKNGIEFLECVNGFSASTPIVLLTGNDNPLLDIHLMFQGVSGFLPKMELSVSALERVIRYAIHYGSGHPSIGSAGHNNGALN